MGIPTIITDLALIMIVASISTVIFKWLKQPIILGYIVAGFLVSKQFVFAPDIIGRDMSRDNVSVIQFDAEHSV